MSPSDSFLGPARRADGSLKDASEIEWSYDKDETLPFPAPRHPLSIHFLLELLHLLRLLVGLVAPCALIALLAVFSRLCLTLKTKLALHREMLVESARLLCCRVLRIA